MNWSPEIKHGASRYDRGCRCGVCRTANTAKQARRRNRRKREQVYAPTTMLEVTERIDSAVDFARQDIKEMIAALNSVPYWRSGVYEAVSGEIAALCELIDSHNKVGNPPFIQYGYDNDVFWYGSPDEKHKYPQSEVSEVVSESSRSVNLHGIQLPQIFPLARPRNVRAGNAPTLPTAPERLPNRQWG